MAIKIISGGLKEKTGEQASKFSPSEETFTGTALRNLARTGSVAAETGFGLLGSLLQPSSEEQDIFKQMGVGPGGAELLPTRESIRSGYTAPFFEETLGQGRGFLDPVGNVEEGLDTLTSLLTPNPLNIIAGPAKLGTAIGTAVGSQIPKALGLGEIPQAIGGAIGGGIKNFWKATSPSSLKKWATTTYEKNYPVARKAATNLQYDASNVANKLKDLKGQLPNQLKGKANLKDIKFNLNKISKIAGKDNQANVLEMWNYKRRLNELIGENLGHDSAVTRNYYKSAIKPVNEFLADASKKYPKFGEPFNLSEDTWKLTNIKGNVLQVVKDSASLKDKLDKLPLAKAAIFGGAAYKFGAIPAIAAGVAGKRAIDLYKIAQNNPTIQNRLLEIAHEASLGNTSNLQNLAVKLNSELSNEVKQIGVPKGMKVISGGLR